MMKKETKYIMSDKVSQELKENLEILNSFLQLENNRNGEGAKNFSYGFIEFVSNIVSDLNVQPDIFPLENGNIVLEFGNVRSKYLEFEIFPNKKVNLYKKDIFGNRTRHNDMLCTINLIKQQVNWFEN